ncbi:hypothetical protein SAMN05421771_2326 [Granulicella pectinivorans]|uniref:Membrane protein 6-pyruvoyl-tetrahydropterin synthase-related domain-containing protein n=1 Tax=Granulicella pectinivorans TaxID=474950 RepID=A0A1I6MD24_9BACT|nr:hypothetical protein [Granulicella pectinivorans]SFS13513.1 hypothetical protein SAMN05421771_2326 [Granulicella pectinivorans]
MRRDRLAHILIPLAALIAVLPLLLQGPSCGHDFVFHTLNWIEAATQFAHGNLHPRWAVSPAYNAGEPRFLFYPPLSWTLGAILGLILPWTWTHIAYTWVALTASGLAMHRLTRAHTSPTTAILASTLYLANPYMLFTAYERTAYAELLAAAFLPLLLHAILKYRPTIPGIAVPLALLWLTNAPAAVMATYTLALLAVLRLAKNPGDPHPASGMWLPPQGKKPLAITIALGTLLGFALATFYILPAAYERRYVQIAMAIIPGMRIEDNTLFHHTGITEDAIAHDAVLHTASLLAVLLLIVTTIALLTSRKNPTRTPITVLTATIALLLTPIATPIWHHLPELAFLQFPWRLLAILGGAMALAIAKALSSITLKPKFLIPATLALAAALSLPAAHLFRQPCDDADTIPTRLALFHAHTGTEPTDEYTPTTADNDSLKHNNPPYFLAATPDAPVPNNSQAGPSPRDLTLTPSTPTNLILNLRQYPDWQITINNRPTALGPSREDGLTTIPLPAGQDHIHIAFRTTPLERTAEAISLMALLTLGFTLKRKPLP